MCLTYPGRIVRVNGEFASVDFGPSGVRDKINVSLIEAEVGSYVLVQGGFAIRVLTKEEADAALETWNMILEGLQ